jgi:hypothetical protein
MGYPIGQFIADIWDTVNHKIKVDATMTGGAMTVADGADVTLGAKADARSTATDTTAVTEMQVLKEISYMEQNPASRAVTLATAPALVAGTAMIGSVQDAGPGAGAGVFEAPQHGDMGTAPVAVSAAPTAGQKVCIRDIVIMTVAACEVHLEEQTSGTTIWGPAPMAANGYLHDVPRGKLKLATADKYVLAHSSTTDHVTVQISTVSET